MTTHRFETLQAAREYALAGNATLTLESAKTGIHFTYRVRQGKDRLTGEPVTGTYFVSLLTGQDNENDYNYNYLGLIRDGAFRLTKASKTTKEAASVKAFSFFFHSSELHPALIVRHEGRCGRCGRTLTVPESIDAGIGPECASKMD